MTIEIKKVASVNEAISIINRLNYTNETFHYNNSTYSNDYKVEYRFCDGVRDNDLYSGMSIIEIVVDGTLQTVRFFNHFCDITVDLRIGDFMPEYDRFDNVIDTDAKVESATEKSAPVDDFEAKLAELQANVDAAKADYEAKNAELDRLQAAVENAKAEESIAWSKYFRLKDALSEFVRAKAKELCDTLIDDTILKAGKFQCTTDSGSLVEEFCSQIAITFFNGKFRIAGWQNKLAHYDTPAQVTAAINQLKAAIIRGDKEFKFPTIEQFKLQHAKNVFKDLYRYRELYHIISSNGQHMWYSFFKRISSKARDSILKEYGITVDEFLAAEKIVEAEWEVEYEAKAEIHDQAKFLWDKIQRESKPLDDDNVADLLPSVDVLNDVQIDEPPAPYKPQCTWEDPHDYGEPGTLNFDPNDRLRAYQNSVDDRLIRAMRHNLLKVQAACKSHDINAALNELKLFAICRDAHKLEKEFTPTPKRDRQKPDTVDYEQIEAKAIKYDDTVKDLDKQIETVEDECAFNQVCYDEPDDSRERVHFDAELKKLIDKGLKLIKKRDTLKIHRDRLYLTIEKLDAQAI